MLRRFVLAHRHYSGYLSISLPSLPTILHHHLFSHSNCQRCCTNLAVAYQRTTPRLNRGDTVAITPVIRDRELRTARNSPLNLRSYSRPVDPLVLAMVRSVLLGSGENPEKLLDSRVSAQMREHLAHAENIRKVAEALARVKPLHALQFLRLIQKLPYPVKQNAYESICFCFANSTDWSYILDAVSLGTLQTGRTTVRLLNWKARALLEMRHYGPLEDILKEFEQFSLKPNRRTYHLVLTGHIRNCNIIRARHCLQQMREAGFLPDTSTHALLAMNHRSLGSDIRVQSHALQVLSQKDSMTGVAVLNSLIQLRLDSQDISAAFRLLSYFTPSSTQVLMDALSRNDRSAGTSKHGASYTSHPPPFRHFLMPDATTYAIIINYLAHHGVVSGIADVLYVMASNGIKATPAIVICLVHMFASAGRTDAVVKLVASTCNKETSHLETLIPVSPKAQDALCLIDCTEIQPSTALFNALLKHTLQTSGLKAMNVILKVMRANHVTPDAGTLDIFLAYLRKRENVCPQFLLHILRRLTSSAIYPTSRQLHSILSCALRREKFLLHGSGWNIAAARLSGPQHAKSRPNRERQIIATPDPFDPSAGLQLPRWMEYESVVEPLIFSGVKSDAATFALRIRHDAVIKSDIESAEDIFRTLLDRGIHPTEYHYSALLEGCTIVGDMDRAKAIIQSMKKKPNVVMYTILIVGYGRCGAPEKALKIFQKMIDEGCRPDIPAIDALCGAFFASGAHWLAKRMLINCWTYIQPFPNEYHSLSLRELSTRFRSLHSGAHIISKSLTKEQRRLLHFKIRDILLKWRSAHSAVNHSSLSRK